MELGESNRGTDGTSIYLTRDIGGAIERYEKYKFDKMIYVVASQQDLHLAQFFKVLDLMEFPWAKTLQHVNFGMVSILRPWKLYPICSSYIGSGNVDSKRNGGFLD